jgi:hypothetical protein
LAVCGRSVRLSSISLANSWEKFRLRGDLSRHVLGMTSRNWMSIRSMMPGIQSEISATRTSIKLM